MLRKMRPVLIVVGLLLLVGSIVGARNLTGSGGPEAKAKGGDPAPRATGGPIVLGLVDTDPPPVPYGLPPILQSGTVVKVFVKDGDEVKAGQELYAFDDTIPKAKLESAKAAVEYARTKVGEAAQLVEQHKAALKLADVGISAAKRKVEIAYRTLYFVDKELEKSYKALGHAKEMWPELKLSSLDLVKATADHNVAQSEQEVAEAKKKQLEATDPDVKKKEADAAVKQAEAVQKEAEAAVKLCVVWAKMPGVVEQVSIGAGSTMGVSTRAPALWLIPTGARVVRAEVEAEFAHRVSPALEGKTVTIYDHTDAKLTYSGIVKRVPPTFMLKRASTDSFLGGDTRVIEVLVEVPDHAPANKPPLRVGQRVRVNLGQ